MVYDAKFVNLDTFSNTPSWTTTQIPGWRLCTAPLNRPMYRIEKVILWAACSWFNDKYTDYTFMYNFFSFISIQPCRFPIPALILLKLTGVIPKYVARHSSGILCSSSGLFFSSTSYRSAAEVNSKGMNFSSVCRNSVSANLRPQLAMWMSSWNNLARTLCF